MLILTADKTPDGGAAGRTEWDRGASWRPRPIPAPRGSRPPCSPRPARPTASRRPGPVSRGRRRRPWDLYSVLGVSVPGIQHVFAESADGERTEWMVHPDGSWARATGTRDGPPTVHQSGPQRLWDILDGIRLGWLRDGSLPV